MSKKTGIEKFNEIMQELMTIELHGDTTVIDFDGDPVQIMKQQYPEEKEFIEWLEMFDQ